MWTRYGKAIVGVLTAIAVMGVTVTTDNLITGEEWFQVLTEAVMALGVFLVPVFPEYPWLKTVQAALLTGLMVSVTLVLDGVTANDALVILVAILGAISVAVAPAKSDIDPRVHRSV